MLAYRHAFHAGNHADVLKHLVLVQVLRYLGEKDKPYWLIDTHAGAGAYKLQSRHAQQNAEFENGISRLWGRDDLPPAVADYVDLVRAHNPGGTLKHYPGSPALALQLLRPQDRLRLWELHPTDLKLLAQHFGQQPHTEVHHGDGFSGLKSQLPPPSRRGAVLIDPPYEMKADYGLVVNTVRDAMKRFAEGVVMVWYPQLPRLESQLPPPSRRGAVLIDPPYEMKADYSLVVNTVRDAMKRFAEGVVMVWYPQLPRLESQQLPQRLKAAAPKGWLHVRMTVQKPGVDGFGLIGSGLVVINPPWVLHDTLQGVMPWLTEALAQYDGASYVLEQHAV